MKTATAQIDLMALKENFHQIQQIASGSMVLAVLKANAYGHGLVKVAEQLKDADAFGVARIEEALALRAGGIVKPIVLLEGFLEADDLPVLVANNIEAVVHIQEQVELIEQAQLSAPIKVWLKVDTGMHRLGLMPQQFLKAFERLKVSANVKPQMCLMSHLACADERDNPMNDGQISLFDEVVLNIDGEYSCEHSCEHSLANSAALIALPETRRDWVRPGLWCMVFYLSMVLM